MKEKRKQNVRGITLISLVITIIVLLILAGVAISMALNEGNFFSKANEAKSSWNVKTAEENGINDTLEYIEQYAKAYNNSDNDIQLSFEEIESESRATIIKVSIDGLEIPTLEEWLRSLETEELKTMFVNKMTNGSATWEQACSGTTDVEDWYSKRVGNPNSDAYKFMIQQGWYDDTDYRATYITTFSLGSQTITGTNAEFIVTENGEYTISATKGNGSGILKANVTKCNVETYKFPTAIDGTFDAKGNCIIAQGDYEAVIPAGFAFGTSSNVGTISTGLVITDNIDTETGYSIGNEFVWIPINKETLVPVGGRWQYTYGKQPRNKSRIV